MNKSTSEYKLGFSISCFNIPDDFINDKILAKQHFQKFGKVARIIIRPKRKHCIVEFEKAETAKIALHEGGNYDGHKFRVTWTKNKSSEITKEVRKKEKSKNWSQDSEVLAELEAMKGNYTVDNVYSSRTEAGSVEFPKNFSPKIKEKKMRVPKVVEKPVRQWKSDKITKPKVPEVTLNINSEQALELLNIVMRPGETAEEKYRILDARDKLIRLKMVRQSNLSNVTRTVGTCPDMCPEKERLMREAQHQVALYEQLGGNKNSMNHTLSVKQYSRSSADQESPLAHELRPVNVLQTTMGYLLHRIMDLCETPDVNLAEWYHFLWDRTRGIRKDITQQELCCQGSVGLIEQCARFHVHCSARLVAEDVSVFDQKINTENLTKCLQTLKYMYHDLALQGVRCLHEAEFRGYIVLLNLNDGNFMWEVQQLSREIQESQEIKFALQVYSALDKNNYVRFFKYVQSTTYLNACILLRYFNQVRVQALRRILKSYSPRQPFTNFPIAEITNILAFEDENSTMDFLEHYGMSVNKEGTHVLLDRKMFKQPDIPFQNERAIKVIESKRNISVGEVVYGTLLPPKYYQNIVPHNSFDGDGYLKENEIPSEWQSKYSDRLLSKEKGSVDNKYETECEKDKAMELKNTEPEFTFCLPSTVDFKMDTNVLVPDMRTFQFQLPENLTPPLEKEERPLEQNDFKTFDTTDSLHKKRDKNNLFGNKDHSISTSECNVFQTANTDDVNIFNRNEDTGFKSSGHNLFQTNKESSTIESNESSIFSKTENIFNKNENISSKNDAKILNTENTFNSNKNIPNQKENSSSIFANKVYSTLPKMPTKPTKQPDTPNIPNFPIFGGQVESKNIFQSIAKPVLLVNVPPDTTHIIFHPVAQNVNIARKSPKEKVEKTNKRTRQYVESEEYSIEPKTDKPQIVVISNVLVKERRTDNKPNVDKKEVRKLLDDIIGDVEKQNEIDLKLRKISDKIKNRKISGYINKWRNVVKITKRKRKSFFDNPVWIQSRSIGEEAKELYLHSQSITLHNMKRYKKGMKSNITPNTTPEEIRKLNISDIVWKILYEKLNSFGEFPHVDIFWKIGISVSNGKSYSSKHLEDCLYESFDWKSTNGVIKTVEKTQTSNGGTFNYCIQNLTNKIYNDLNGLCCLVDYNLFGTFNERFKRLLATKQSSIPVIVIITNKSEDKSIKERLEGMIDAADVRKYEIVFIKGNVTIPVLTASLQWLAHNVQAIPPLQMDALFTLLHSCTGNEFWHRVDASSKVNKRLRILLRNPNIAIRLYNKALEQVSDMVCQSESHRFLDFPTEFKEYIRSYFVTLPCSYEYFPKDWKTESYCNNIKSVIKSMVLPEFEAKWPPSSPNDMVMEIERYCSGIFSNSNVFLRILNALSSLIEYSERDFADWAKSITWIDILSIIVREKINNLENDYDEIIMAIYRVEDLKELCKVPWWYATEEIHAKIKTVREEFDEAIALNKSHDKSQEIEDELDIDETILNVSKSFLHEEEEEEKKNEDMKKDIDDLTAMINDVEESMIIQRRIMAKFNETANLLLKEEFVNCNHKK